MKETGPFLRIQSALLTPVYIVNCLVGAWVTSLKSIIVILISALLLHAGVSLAQEKLKVALILPGPVNDLSWNAVAYQGLKETSKKFNMELAYQENVADADVERVLRDYAGRGYNLILAESFNYQDAVIKVANDFPRIKFATATGFKVKAAGFADVPSNHAVYDWPAHQAGYLSGALAALMSKTQRVGFVGGYEVPDIIRQAEGYKQGVRAINPGVKTSIIYTGSWSDAEKGKEAALSLIDLGADVVAQAADGPGVGAILAAKSRNVYAIGYVADQNPIAPKHVLTSVVLEKGVAYSKIIEDVLTGKFESKGYYFDMLSNGVSLAPYHGLVPEDIQRKIEEIKGKIMKGEIIVEERVKSTH